MRNVTAFSELSSEFSVSQSDKPPIEALAKKNAAQRFVSLRGLFMSRIIAAVAAIRNNRASMTVQSQNDRLIVPSNHS